MPVVLGHEFSGVIAKKGKNVKKWQVGDRVVSDNTGYVCGECFACATGKYLMCPERKGIGYGMDGGFTDYVKINGDLLERNPKSLFRIPDNVSFEEAAILDPICNAYKAVVQESSIMPGEDIVIFGVGPLGLFSVQIAKIMGCANIIAVGLEADKEWQKNMGQPIRSCRMLKICMNEWMKLQKRKSPESLLMLRESILS